MQLCDPIDFLLERCVWTVCNFFMLLDVYVAATIVFFVVVCFCVIENINKIKFIWLFVSCVIFGTVAII